MQTTEQQRFTTKQTAKFDAHFGIFVALQLQKDYVTVQH
jgi:hypothetical protein